MKATLTDEELCEREFIARTARIPPHFRGRFPWAPPKAARDLKTIDHLLIVDVLRGYLPPRIKIIGKDDWRPGARLRSIVNDDSTFGSEQSY